MSSQELVSGCWDNMTAEQLKAYVFHYSNQNNLLWDYIELLEQEGGEEVKQRALGKWLGI